MTTNNAGEATMEPTSDVQFIAQMLVQTRRGDQISREQADRLEDIAENGHTTGRTPRANQPVEVPDADALRGTRVGGGQL